jgi:hypothetical protein
VHTGFLWRSLRERYQPLVIPRRIREDNIKTDLQEVGGLDWIVLVQLVVQLCLVSFLPIPKIRTAVTFKNSNKTRSGIPVC